ncbi:MAG: SUMF1/EgtB/PvdO family nonheme iron enzyme, partial [Planctomycetota bacterium]
METSRAAARPSMGEIQRRVTGVLVTQTGADPSTLRPETDLVRDLGIDSLDLVEIFMEVEQDLGVTLPEERQSADQFYKRAFTGPLTLRTLVELVHVRWGSGAPERRRIDPAPLVDLDRAGFAQRGWDAVDSGPEVPVYEHVGSNRSGLALHRRERDGMPCVLVPGGRATIGSSGDAAGDDERPPHTVRLSPYLLDLELVSITAYCRFLNSVDVADERTLRRWFLLEPGDRRQRHACVERNGADWRPRPGAAEWPMVLVSWHGARAYARWAHGLDPLDPDGPSHLPTEAQWEHAARGGGASDWPWGDAPPAPGRLRAGRAREAQRAG